MATPSPLSPPPGYEPQLTLSQGPGTWVLRARDPRGQSVALRLSSAGDSQGAAELALLSAVRDPEIAAFVDGGALPGGGRFLARTWIEGEELGKWAKGRSGEEIGVVVARLAAVLQRLHQGGFVHGDLKPANVIVSADGKPRLCDFGLSRSSSAGAGQAGGSLFYAAPEILMDGPPSPHTDLFALGVLLHELFVAERPSARDFYGRFPGKPFLESVDTTPEVFPEWLRDVVVALLQRDASRRPSSAGEVAQTLAQRLGASVEVQDRAGQLSWSPALGRRESWKAWLDAHREKRNEGSGLHWMRIPDGEDVRFFARELRLFLAQNGVTSEGIAWEDHVTEIHSLADLDRRCGQLFEEQPNELLVVWMQEPSAWSNRTIEHAALRLRRMREDAVGGRMPLLVVVAGFEPSARLFDVLRAPRILSETVERYLRGSIEEPEAKRLSTFAKRLAQAARGSATHLDALLGRAARRGWVLVDGPRPRLRPGPLPTVEVLAKEAAPSVLATPSDLDPQAAVVLAACAVIGSPASLLDLEQLLEVTPEDLAGRLQALFESGAARLVRAAGGARLELSMHLPDASHVEVRRGLHGRWAQELETRGAAPAEVLPHRWASNPTRERTAEVLDHAAELRERGLVERALAMLEAIEETGRSLAIEFAASSPELVAEKAECWCELGQPEHASGVIDELLAVAGEDKSLLARAELIRARVSNLRHRPDEAQAQTQRASELAPELEVIAVAGRLELAHLSGRDDEVRELARMLDLDALERVGASRRRRVYIESLVAMSAFRQGESSLARETIKRLVDEAQRIGDDVREAALRLHLATIERRTGAKRGGARIARKELERSGRLFDRSGHLAGSAHVRATMAGLLRDRGELVEAEELYASARDIRVRLNDVEGAAMIQGMIGLLAAERGHARRAIEDLERSANALSGATSLRHALFLRAKRFEVQSRIGASLAGLQDLLAQRAERASDPRVGLALARAHWSSADPRTAQALAQEAAQDARRLGRQPVLVDAENLLSALSFGSSAGSTGGAGADGPAEHGQGHGDGRDESHADGLGEEGGACLAASLEEQDRQLFALLSADADFVPADARELAQALFDAGRDDRAARLFFAVAARESDARRARRAREQGEEALRRCTNGLVEGEQVRLREHLLGFPDPWPEELLPPRQESWDGVPTKELVSLLEVSGNLLEQEDLPALLGLIVDHAIEISRAERGFLILEELGSLRFDTATHSLRGEISAPDLEVSYSVVRDALAEMKPMRVSNAVDDPLLQDSVSVNSLELRSVMCIPFHVSDRTRGVLYLDHRLRTRAFDVTCERLCGLLAGQAALAIRHAMSREQIRELNRTLRHRVSASEADLAKARRALGRTGTTGGATQIIGRSAAITQVQDMIDRAARTDLSVLVLGPSGSGKELVARALHERSGRSAGPFIVENCAAIPATLIEAELFGHAKGAFTDAHRDRAGLFEAANGGTLFLDEIGEMPLEAQTRLLRTLETGEVRRVGESKTRRSDFRLVTATNRELVDEVEAGRFRRDLFYRLDGWRIVLPSLEERIEDLPDLVRHFLALEEAKSGRARRISAGLLSQMSKRSWPGNVRELANEVNRLCAMCDGDLDDPTLLRTPEAPGSAIELMPLAVMERKMIMEALEHTRGDKQQAARLLGVSRSKIYQRLRQWAEDGSSRPQDASRIARWTNEP